MLRSLNEKLLNELKEYREQLNLSGPLLVDSSKEFFDIYKWNGRSFCLKIGLSIYLDIYSDLYMLDIHVRLCMSLF